MLVSLPYRLVAYKHRGFRDLHPPEEFIRVGFL